MSIFSLQEARAEQIKNVVYNDARFSYWPESAVYGYYCGGFNSSPSEISTISRLNFSNETVSNPGQNLLTPRGFSAATSSNFYGYIAGGANPTIRNVITRLDFSSETISNPGKNLPSGRYLLAATSSSFYGYFGGGYILPNTFFNTITRLDFSNETVSNPGNNFPTGRDELAVASSNFYGYFGGGSVPSTPLPVNVNTITRLDFSTETIVNPGNNLSQARYGLAAMSSSSYGYFGGGYIGPPIFSIYCTIDRLDFSNETISNPGKSFTDARSFLDTTSNFSYGYFGGGYDYFFNVTCTVIRLDFSTETISNTGQNLPSARDGAAGLSGGQSV